MKKLIWMLMGVFAFMFAANAFAVFNVPVKRPSADQWCFDLANVLNSDIEEKIEEEAAAIQRSFDADLVVVTVPSLDGGDVDLYTAELFSKWEIGKGTQGKKGILFLIALKELQVRIEVGYDLESIYTDAYVGMVERDILKEFLEQGEWGTGFLATIESFLFRIYNQDLQEEIRGISSGNDQLEYYSDGAGASNVFDFGSALKRPLPDNYDDIREYFSAQPTPELAFQRYMQLCAQAVKHNNDLTLFTELSNEFWKNWKHTSGQQRAEAEEMSGRQYHIKSDEEHAVVFFPAPDPKEMRKSSMYFLANSEQGWQVDISTMTRCMRCVGPGWWILTDIFHPYSALIIEEYNLVQGFLAPLGDTTGGDHIYPMGGVPNDENIPGVSIGVWHGYEDQSNLKREDSIVAVNGEKVRDVKHLRSFFDGAQAGERFEIELIRDGKKMNVTEEVPRAADGFKYFRPCLKTPRQWLGVYMVQSLDSEWNVTRRLRDQGMFVNSSLCEIIDIYPGSPADRAGLKVRDLIVDYGVDDDNGEVMPRDVIEHLYQTQPGESMTLTVVRDLKDVLKIKVTPEETMTRGYF